MESVKSIETGRPPFILVSYNLRGGGAAGRIRGRRVKIDIRMRTSQFLTIPLLAAVLVGCSESPTPETKPQEKAPEPVTGLSALTKMFQVARAWSGDVQVLKMNSIVLSEVKQVPGKAAAWEATFASPSKGLQKSWTFSIIEAAGNLHEGVFGGSEAPWTASAETPAFLISAAKKDTDGAYKTALGKAADAAKKNEGKPISFFLETSRKFPNPAWRVVWGESLGTSGLSVLVDATTGEYLQTLH